MPKAKASVAGAVAALKPQSFVLTLTRSGAKGKLRVIRGYAGESEQANSTRIYLDVELRRFVDIPNDGIVHSEAIPTTVIPLGAVYVWVRDDVRITHRGNWAGPEDPTTMATGEEGGDPTTMATGEEGMGFENPLDLVVNPFGRF